MGGEIGRYCGLPILTTSAFFDDKNSQKAIIEAVDISCKGEATDFVEEYLKSR